MSKKTKAMEAQIAQYAVENAELKTQVSALELELSACKDELSNTALELANAKRRLDDFRARQEEIIAALTEAHNARERIIANARQKAGEIVSGANAEKQAVLTEANEKFAEAKRNAESVLSKASADAEITIAEAKRNAESMLSKASADAEITVGTANKKAEEIVEAANLRSEKLLEDAKLKAEELTEAVELRISERRSELDSLTVTLHEKASLAFDQTKAYAELLNMIADCECIKALSDDDELNDAEDAEGESAVQREAEPKDGKNEIPETKTAAVAAETQTVPELKNCFPPCGKKKFCCETEPVGNPETGEKNETAEPTGAVSVKADEPDKAKIEDAETPAEKMSADEMPPERKTEGNDASEPNGSETAVDGRQASGADLPTGYADAASLMRNIYALEGRELPEEVSQEDNVQSGDEKNAETETEAPAGNAEAENENENDAPAIPVDPELNVILNDLMSILDE